MEFETLVQQPESLRDERWEARFLDGILQREVEVIDDRPQTGPDGWPYMLVKTGSEKAVEPFYNMVKWLSERGIGLVVNPHKMVPDYVFTYGMIWNLIETGRFVLPQEPPSVATGGEAVSFNKKLIAGAPTEKYLPLYVRKVLRQFLAAQGIENPRILVVTSEDFKNIDLVFSLASLGLAPGDWHPDSEADLKKHETALAETLTWFFPLHYKLVLARHENLPPFYDL